jgi:ubiquinone/menaquinone biosynthesis C-methylase UbiE
MDIETEVARHYGQTDLTGAVLDALRRSGKDPERLAAADLAAVDEFHLGWRPATIEFAQALGLTPGMAVLDVGSGIGGPARYFAQAHGCDVTGIDLTPDFVELATELTARTGLGESARFVAGSALAMPFRDAAFDAATLIHVGMNIADKPRLFAEIRRVLRPGGRFGLFEVMRAAEGPLPMPMPWADSEATSFVETPGTYRRLLEEAGFRVRGERDRSAFVLALAESMRARIAAEGLPILGLHLVVGPTALERVGRLIECVGSGLVAPVEMVAEPA